MNTMMVPHGRSSRQLGSTDSYDLVPSTKKQSYPPHGTASHGATELYAVPPRSQLDQRPLPLDGRSTSRDPRLSREYEFDDRRNPISEGRPYSSHSSFGRPSSSNMRERFDDGLDNVSHASLSTGSAAHARDVQPKMHRGPQGMMYSDPSKPPLRSLGHDMIVASRKRVDLHDNGMYENHHRHREDLGNNNISPGGNGATNNAELEARAIAQAMQSADESYVPSPSLLASDDPEALLSQVDGPSLATLYSKPVVYQARSVPVALRAKLDIPIHVTAGGSVIEYEFMTEDYDIAFGVTAEREEGVTDVVGSVRVDSHLEPVKGKFLVGSVPCTLTFTFDNEYSWCRGKLVWYKITVSPPRLLEHVVQGRRLRATKALELVTKDIMDMDVRYDTATAKRAQLEEEVMKLEKELAEKKKSLDVVWTEEKWLEKQRGVRAQQIMMLNVRLEKGWEDEKF